MIQPEFQKVFDQVPHKMLLFKLRAHDGIKEHLCTWIEDWLSERQ